MFCFKIVKIKLKYRLLEQINLCLLFPQDLNHSILVNNVEEKQEHGIDEDAIEDEEGQEEDDGDYTVQESLEDTIEEVVEIDNDENEPG